MLRRQGWTTTRALGFVLSAAVLFLSGCGPALVQREAFELFPAGPEARPVADVTGRQMGLASFFMGLGLSRILPVDSSLDSSTGYDFNMAFDIAPALTLEVLVGSWEMPDRPIDGADSNLEMVPMLVMAQFQKQVARWKSRFYVGAGGGYSFNNYALGGAHRLVAISELGVLTYDVEADDGALLQFCVGAEMYSSENADLNLGLEIRRLWGELESTERIDLNRRSHTVDLELYLFRANVTWHF